MTEWLEVVDEVAFKRVPDGYVLWDVSRRPFGRERRYLVDEARKEEILTALYRSRIVRAALLVLLIAGVVGFVATFPQEKWNEPHYGLLVFVGAILALSLSELVSLRRLRPLIADAPRVEPTMTRRESRRLWLGRVIDVTSFRQLGLLALLFAFLAAVNLREYGWQGATFFLVAMAPGYLVLAVIKACRRAPAAVARD